VGEGWEADAALDRLGMADHVDAPIAALSGGQAKRVASLGADPSGRTPRPGRADEPSRSGGGGLARTPTAGFRGGLVLVTHDRIFSTPSPPGSSSSTGARSISMTAGTTPTWRPKPIAKNSGISGSHPAESGPPGAGVAASRAQARSRKPRPDRRRRPSDRGAAAADRQQPCSKWTGAHRAWATRWLSASVSVSVTTGPGAA